MNRSCLWQWSVIITVPVDLAYVIFIDFLALGVLGFYFLLLSNVQFLVLVNLPLGLATRVACPLEGRAAAACRQELLTRKLILSGIVE